MISNFTLLNITESKLILFSYNKSLTFFNREALRKLMNVNGTGQNFMTIFQKKTTITHYFIVE
jgi:adenine-specific DNA methylase